MCWNLPIKQRSLISHLHEFSINWQRLWIWNANFGLQMIINQNRWCHKRFCTKYQTTQRSINIHLYQAHTRKNDTDAAKITCCWPSINQHFKTNIRVANFYDFITDAVRVEYARYWWIQCIESCILHLDLISFRLCRSRFCNSLFFFFCLIS